MNAKTIKIKTRFKEYTRIIKNNFDEWCDQATNIDYQLAKKQFDYYKNVKDKKMSIDIYMMLSIDKINSAYSESIDNIIKLKLIKNKLTSLFSLREDLVIKYFSKETFKIEDYRNLMSEFILTSFNLKEESIAERNELQNKPIITINTEYLSTVDNIQEVVPQDNQINEYKSLYPYLNITDIDLQNQTILANKIKLYNICLSLAKEYLNGERTKHYSARIMGYMFQSELIIGGKTNIEKNEICLFIIGRTVSDMSFLSKPCTQKKGIRNVTTIKHLQKIRTQLTEDKDISSESITKIIDSDIKLLR